MTKVVGAPDVDSSEVITPTALESAQLILDQAKRVASHHHPVNVIRPVLQVNTNPVHVPVHRGRAVDAYPDGDVYLPPYAPTDSSNSKPCLVMWPLGILAGIVAGAVGWKLYSKRKERKDDEVLLRFPSPPRAAAAPQAAPMHHHHRCPQPQCHHCQPRQPERAESNRTPACDCKRHRHCPRCGGRNSSTYIRHADSENSGESLNTSTLEKLKRRQVWRPR